MLKDNIKNRKAVVWSLLVLVAVLWGLSFFGSTCALKYVEPIELLSVRWTIAAFLFLSLIALGIIKVYYKGKPNKYLMLMALRQPCLYSAFELLGIKYTTTSESSIIIAMIPIVVIVLSGVFLREKYSRKVKMAVAVAFLGLVISTYFAPNFSFGGEGIGYLYLFIAIIIGGIYNLMVNRLSKYYSVFEMSTVMTVSGTIFYNIISIAQGNFIHPWKVLISNGDFALSALYLGIGCSFLAYLTYNYILTKLPPGIASCLQANGITVVGVLSGIILAGDSFGWYTIVGMGLVCFGIAVTSFEGNKVIKKDYKLIIFDLDGTLLNTLEDITDSLNHILHQYGFETRTIKQVEAAIGNGYKRLIGLSVPEGAEPSIVEEMVADFRQYYKAHSTIKTKPYEGIVEMVAKLAENGYMTAIASNKAQSGVDVLKDRFFKENVTVAYGVKPGRKRKPNPQMIKDIMEKCHVKANEVLYVGDSEVDIKTANNAHIDFVIASWGYRSKEQLEKAGGKQFVDRPDEICRILEEKRV